MDEKNYAEVLINGNVYTLGGAEDQEVDLPAEGGCLFCEDRRLKACWAPTRQNKDYQEVELFEPGGRLF